MANTFGTSSADTIIGSSASDTIYGGTGTSGVGTGADVLFGGASGGDTLFGLDGADRLFGGTSPDSLFGGDGNDRLIGGTDRDRLEGDSADDRIDAGSGSDVVNGGTGNDRLSGGSGGDDLDGGDGNDLVSGDGGGDTIEGGTGTDRLFGGLGDDLIPTASVLDSLVVGGAGRDTVTFGATSDTLTAGTWLVDLIQLGSGNDVFDLPTVQGVGSILDLNDIDSSDGFRLDGSVSGEALGTTLRAAGDLNGDGFADFIVGSNASDAVASNAGRGWVVFGKGTAFTFELESTALNGSNGFRLGGLAANAGLGSDVAAAGDFNGDGFGDLIIGASGDSVLGSSSGRAFVVLGKASGFDADLSLSTELTGNGFALGSSQVSAQVGSSVAGLGDINGDGIDDILVGAANASESGSDSKGSAYVVFGTTSAFAGTTDLNGGAVAGFRLIGAANGDDLGTSAAGIGDFNGDGKADLIVGAIGADATGLNAGAAYVVFGSASFATSINVSTLDGSNGFRIVGTDVGQLGKTVRGAGDVNGDGLDDLIIGSETADINGAISGSAWVLFGRTSGFAASLDLRDLDGSDGFRLDGQVRNDLAGGAVSGAGDVNGDGYADLLVGARLASPETFTSPGQTYLIYGRADFEPVISLGELTAAEGMTLVGEGSSDNLGASVSGAGDINGDGYDDMLVGAIGFANVSATGAGAAYALFGGSRFGLPVDGAGYTVDGGSGNDTFDGANGDDVLTGGSGSDVFTDSEGNDSLDGGDGFDSVTYDGNVSGIVADLVAGTVAKGDQGIDRITSFETLTGSFTDDRITGDNAANSLNGNFGDDQVSGAGGNDFIRGNDGDDTLYGGSGNDQLISDAGDDIIHGGSGGDFGDGGAGDDQIFGGDGHDFLTGGGDDDYLAGGTGNDNVEGGTGGDILEAGSGNDSISGNAGQDTLFGGTGDDIIEPGTEQDSVSGGDGIDQVSYFFDSAMIINLAVGQAINNGVVDWLSAIENVIGSGGNDVITGDGVANHLRSLTGDDFIDAAGGNDTLDGEAGFDMLFGGDGNDLLIDGSFNPNGANQLFGGNGSDTAAYAFGVVVASLTGQFASVDGTLRDSLSSIENLTSGVGNDQLQGNAGVNTLSGGFGSDLLFGEDGDDVLIGGDASVGSFNQLFGGNGSDTAAYTAETAQVLSSTGQFFALVGGVLYDQFSSIENLVGGSGNDELQGDDGVNTLAGGDGSDVLLGFGGDDLLIGGNSTVGGFNQLLGGTGNDTATYADRSADVFADLTGFFANVGGTLTDLFNSVENLVGGTGSDQLYGDASVNRLFGGNGGDILQGRGGTDSLTGGAGADAFVHASGDDNDFITDFNRGEGDRVDLASGITFVSAGGVGSEHIATLSDGTTMTAQLGHAWQALDFI